LDETPATTDPIHTCQYFLGRVWNWRGYTNQSPKKPTRI
jgi:hypothetical protein